MEAAAEVGGAVGAEDGVGARRGGAQKSVKQVRKSTTKGDSHNPAQLVPMSTCSRRVAQRTRSSWSKVHMVMVVWVHEKDRRLGAGGKSENRHGRLERERHKKKQSSCRRWIRVIPLDASPKCQSCMSGQACSCELSLHILMICNFSQPAFLPLSATV